jgi:hypothetical protein
VQKFQGHVLHGRKLILEIAVLKGQTTKPLTKPKEVCAPAVKVPLPASDVEQPNENESDTKFDQQLPRPALQIILFGVPSYVNKKALKESIRQRHKCAKLEIELITEVSFFIKRHLLPSSFNYLICPI